uniref:Uncharacterized protein n=1 Tax=Salix viminalis TaxID=40686 RepID=A0A6N2KDF3_SALVM
MAMSGMDSLGEKATKMREALQESQTITDNVTFLGSFDSRLSILETAIHPTRNGPRTRKIPGGSNNERDDDAEGINLEIRGTNKFRQTGIEPSLKLTFDRMYYRVIATGQYAWASSSSAVGANEVDLGISNVSLEGADLEEEAKIQRRMSI